MEAAPICLVLDAMASGTQFLDALCYVNTLFLPLMSLLVRWMWALNISLGFVSFLGMQFDKAIGCYWSSLVADTYDIVKFTVRPDDL